MSKKKAPPPPLVVPILRPLPDSIETDSIETKQSATSSSRPHDRNKRKSQSLDTSHSYSGFKSGDLATTSSPLPSSPSVSSKMSKVLRLAKKRMVNYSYFERLHLGGGGENRVHWMNMVRIRRSDLNKAYRRRGPTLNRRGREYYSLGMSVGAILASTKDANVMLDRIRQLLLEYEFCYHSKGSATQNISLMMATDRGLFPVGNLESQCLSSTNSSDTGSGPTPTLYKQYTKPLYLMLETSQCPGQHVDYMEIVLSLCTVLRDMYQRVMESAEVISISDRRSNTLLNIDGCLKKRVVNPLSQDMHNIAVDLLREQQNDIATLFDSDLLLPTMFGKEPAANALIQGNTKKEKKVWTVQGKEEQ